MNGNASLSEMNQSADIQPQPTTPSERSLAPATFIVTAAIYMLLDFIGFSGPWMAALKIVPIITLARLALLYLRAPAHRTTLIFTLAALGFSALGDGLLALDFPNQFAFGLGAFLLAQLIYAANFLRAANFRSLRFALRGIPVLIAAWLLAGEILPAAGDFSLAVQLYLLAIVAMALSAAAHKGHSTLLFFGALIFMASDTLIAINKFVLPLPMAGSSIMLTYYAAQLALLYGIVRARA